MRLLIAGSRSILIDNADVERLMHDEINRRILKAKLETREDFSVLHGGCPTGADAIADRLCKKWQITHMVYPADWKKHGKAAGPIRNRQMAAECDMALLFFKNGAPNAGTGNMQQELDKLRKYYLTYWI
jgi:hypothetical protein